MKLSFFACALFCFSLSFAQLSVRNDAYLFVSDQVLYVNDDVNLQEADSKIYLRNESQLIQGSGTTGNSGVGEISVYQTGNVNQWSYNYWCSPVGNNSASYGNEDARVNLIDDATGLITSTDALFTSNHNGSSSPLTISNRWLWTYQLSNQYIDWVYAGATGNIAPGLGFTMKGNGTGLTGSQRYDFRGKPNNGTIGNSVANGLHTLIGNPYPSALDASLFIHDSSVQANTTGTLLFWEQDGTVASHTLQDYIGGYYTFTINSAGTLITDAPAPFSTYDEQDNSFPLAIPANGMKYSRRYIPIGQGFMIEGTTGTTAAPSIIYTRNAHRAFAKESDGESIFFRGTNNEEENLNTTTTQIQFQENGLPIVPDDFKRFRINVDFNVNGSFYTRPLILNFHDSATAGFDYGLELVRNASLVNDAYFYSENTIYSGQAFPFETTLAIPVTVDIEQQQALRIRIFDIQNFEASQGIYLHDVVNDSYINLRDQDYELNIEQGSYTNRFEIVFTTESTLHVDDIAASTLSIVQNNNNRQLTVFNPNSIAIKTIELFDVSGKRIYDLPIQTISDHYNVATASISDGVYVVKVSTAANTTLKSQKIIVKN
ncbi:T9SS type A sorting domain-containing protein [Winogradskyella eckloniae]|uniref:T9SS type A sorting domain-containing protein n=1 Tax=Winogradskyella eckloniae TaxID=1089306 RepID=UPI0015640D92|nr:T9SS type A sorting domain-containing protein [Winogradskyella eckloniae]NRD20338.1 T9SS type A sorting domain-containing protein [Winogradskyella eckloniae]